MNLRPSILLSLFFVNILQAQIKLPKGKLINKHYADTIRYENKLDFICLPVKINNEEKTLIFDTGADLILLAKDSLTKSGAIKIKLSDSQGNSSISEFETAKLLVVSNLNYTDMLTVKTNLPKTLLCFADGLFGNNLIKKSNWQITGNYIVATNKHFKNKLPAVSFYYYNSNRIFSNIKLNDSNLDTCLIDYGGRFGMELPAKFYEDFIAHTKKINATTKKISVKWGVNGKSEPDTITSVNCNIDLNGILLDSVAVTFSKKFRERRIGILLLNRFTSVYIDNSSQKLFFESPVLPTKEILYDTPLSIDLDKNNFVVIGKILNNRTDSIKIGSVLKSINGKLPSDFSTYSSFLQWSQDLRMQKILNIITMDGQELKLQK